MRGVAVTDEIARRLIPWECFGDLLGDPLGGWICCHIGPDESSPLQTQDDQPIEQENLPARGLGQHLERRTTSGGGLGPNFRRRGGRGFTVPARDRTTVAPSPAEPRAPRG